MNRGIAQTIYHCPHCSRNYKRKGYFDRHIACCKIISSSEKIRIQKEEEDFPSGREMYTLIQELMINYNKVNDELTELKKWANKKKRRLNVIDWLNENCKLNQDYFEWLKTIKLTRTQLEYVFQYGHIIGYSYIFQDLLPLTQENNLPIKSFEQKSGTLFIYDEQKKWRPLDGKELESLINIIYKAIIIEYIDWENDNEDKIYTEEFGDTYLEHNRKVTGAGLKKETISQRIKSNLYKYLKHNLKHIIEYEFTF